MTEVFFRPADVHAEDVRDGPVREWGVATGRALREFADDLRVDTAAFVPDGSVLAVSDDQGRVRVRRL
ncbi:hypothetical protein ACFYOT_03220 [Saccharothrix saharensis]|uniref:hypothetical protein n=1 Tax=Saccharothrix saharensis TaxID=571190 RepID=UPI0036784078